MLISDYVGALAFISAGVPDAVDWCDGSDNLIRGLKKDLKAKTIGIIG